MKKITLLAVLLFSTIATAQMDNSWTFGFGLNTIDNSGDGVEDVLDTSAWNTPIFLNSLNFEKRWNKAVATNFGVTINVLDKENVQNGETIQNSQLYFATDLSAKLFYSAYIFGDDRLDWLDAYSVVGAGATMADETFPTANLGLGFNFWLKENIGLRLQTIGKWKLSDNDLMGNHIQHTAEMIIRF